MEKLPFGYLTNKSYWTGKSSVNAVLSFEVTEESVLLRCVGKIAFKRARRHIEVQHGPGHRNRQEIKHRCAQRFRS